MKKILLALFIGTTTWLPAQNELLSGATTGFITAPIYDIEFVYNGDDLVLMAGSYNTGYLYAIDFNWTTDEGVIDWATTTIPNVETTIAGMLGVPTTELEIWDMKVNPKTEAVVMLIFDSEGSITYLFEVKNATDISIISLDDVTYSRVQYTLDDNYLHDMEWSAAEDKLYYSQGDFTLDASIGFVSTPFVHNTTATIHATSVFKSNWGGGYFTQAPLEQLTVTNVNGVNRVMGVTTCAPGFSIPASQVNEATDLISVTEDFNVLFSRPLKTVSVTQVTDGGTASYLFDLHQRGGGTQIIRIGEKYLTGTVTDTNDASQLIRNASGDIQPSLPASEAKEIALNYEMMAYYSDYDLMVLDDNDVLRLIDITSEYLGVDENNVSGTFTLSPSPAIDFITIRFENELPENLDYLIYNTEGKTVMNGKFTGQQIDVSSLEKGNYIITFKAGSQFISSAKLLKI